MKQRWCLLRHSAPERGRILARTFRSPHFYDHFLAERTGACRRGEPMNSNESSVALTLLRQSPYCVWLDEVSSMPMQQALRHLQTGFSNFSDKRSRYPPCQRKSGRQAAE